ncbi:MAG: hypothetical protein WCI62_02010, partial [Erysipelotrichaceae bacterium]
MRKFILSSLLFLLVLGGCAQINQTNLESAILASMEDVANNPNNSINNMRKGLYSYYLPKTVGKVSSTELSSVLISHNTKVLL